MSDKNERVEKVEIKKPKSSKPARQTVYTDGAISMHVDTITTKTAFKLMWQGSKAARGVDLDKAYIKAARFKEKNK